MNVLRLSRHLRPVLWTAAVLGVIAIMAWRANTWSQPSPTSAQDAEPIATDGNSIEPGLTIYPPDERVKAPKLEGTTLDGDSYSVEDVSGYVLVINVWGSWCGPCRAETPDLARLARQDASRGVRFVGINTRDDQAAARAFVRKFDVPYPSVVDEGRVLLNFRGVIPTAVVPTTIVVDRQGKVAARVIGPVTYRTMTGLLDDELAADKVRNASGSAR